ncbi:DUF3558 domain-containing protein [Nocardia lijiangensis]|uniref:DUF3558 domain-containing protein n=1 Tax=Nocardia lijiangensis TaxID=299618 RepID=UPI000A05F101|nr:DUF3558 domain-containing protein [Nocardia lijiangensis]
MARRVMLGVCAAGLMLGTAACGGSTEGTATTSTSAAQAALWNPCTEIPDETLRQIGLDPSTEETGVAGVPQSGWEICSWNAAKYHVTVFSTKRTSDEIQNKPGNVEFQDVQIAGRNGSQYRVEGASKRLTCDIVFSARQGAFSVKVGNNPAEDHPDDPCSLANRAASILVPQFPQ